MFGTDGELSSIRSSFSLKFNTAIWILTSGSQFVLGWWYRSSAVFYLPPGWFGPVTWWLSFPFAPAGSVSCGVWQMACRRVIKVGERVVKDLVAQSEFAWLTCLLLNIMANHIICLRYAVYVPGSEPAAVPSEAQEKKASPASKKDS